MYNIRYHIATVVGIFLALALGLFLGAAITSSGTIDKSGQALVDGLREEFRNLRTENDGLTSTSEHQSALATYVTSQWVKGRLNGQTILVIASSDKEPGYEEATSAITQAGGAVISMFLSEQLTLDKVQELGLVAKSDASVTKDTVMNVLAEKIIPELSLPIESRPTISALVDAGLMTVQNADTATTIGGCVNLATHKETADTLGIALAKQYTAAGKPSLAAKRYEAKSDIIAAGIAAGVPTLDTLEGAYGIEGVVALLSGAPAGDYGVDQPESNWFPKIPVD